MERVSGGSYHMFATHCRNDTSKADGTRSILSACKTVGQNPQTKICHVSRNNQPIKQSVQHRARTILNDKIGHFFMSVNRFRLRYHGDC